MGKAEDLAARQHALLTRAQSDLCGLTARQIQWRLHTDRWVSPMRALYRVAGAPVTAHQAALAACLAGPEGTAVSHLTSLALRGLWPWPLLPHVTVPKACSARMPIAKVHRSDIPAVDLTRCFGMTCTTVARAIVESAAMLSRQNVERVVDSALDRHLTSLREIVATAERSSRAPGRKGLPLLRVAMAEWTDGIRPGSPAEMRLLRQLKQWGYPPPEKQVTLHDAAGKVVAVMDLAWRPRLIGIEYDSTMWHNPRRWAKDEARHLAVEALGYTLLHADKADLMPGERNLRDSLARAWRAAA